MTIRCFKPLRVNTNNSWKRGSAFALLSLAATSAVALAQPSPNASKRGFGGEWVPISNSLNVNWHYDWGHATTPDQRGEYVPMAWNGWSVTDPTRFASLISHSSEYILGFNEPERPDQANMSVATAISLWPQLMASGKKLVSPAVSDTSEGRAWLSSFMSEIRRLNYRVDAIAFHWYGDVRVSSGSTNFLNAVAWYHNNLLDDNGNKLPVWITEFGGLDFSGGANPVTPAMNQAFMEAVLPVLDSRSYVHRYAWWHWGTPTSLGGGTAPFTPSELGHYYNGRTYDEGESLTLVGDEGDDTFYLRGGSLSNTGATTRVIKYVDAISGISEFQGDGRWEQRDGTLRVRSGATLQKLGTNTVYIANTTTTNDGTLVAKAGTLEFADGTVVGGSGILRTEAGGVISLSQSAGAASGVTINNAVQLAGGVFRAPSGGHTLNNSLNVQSTSTINIAGNLTLNGPMTGSANATITGGGTSRFNVGSTHTGTVFVNTGTLISANATGSTTGTGALTIGAGGTLAGDGRIAASSTTIHGTLSPSITGSRPRPFVFATPLVLSSTATTVLDIGTLAADLINSSSTVTLDGVLDLRSLSLAAPLVPMDLINAATLVGTFDQVTGIETANPTRGIAVTYSGTGVRATVTYFGDTDVDGSVDFEDLLVLAQNYDQTGKTWSTGDMTGDGSIGFNDLLFVAQNYGISLAVDSSQFGAGFVTDWNLARSFVPEPTLSLAVALVSMVACRRRRRA
jgi:hypothetical protein